jgi:glycosyltransferase involved in cell wall biosynthesis
MVSALIPSKRVVEGIRAVSQIEDLHLVVCGDGPEREKVNNLGQQLMAGRFHWKKLPREKMPDLYRAADLLLHLSLDEPFGNVYIEALATGLPIVSHESEVTRWMLEETAVLVDTTEEVQVIAGIHQALQRSSPEDISGRRKLVERRFAWSQIGQTYYEFLKDVLKGVSNKLGIIT